MAGLPDRPLPLRPGDDVERERALRRMKGWATGLLILAGIVFAVARYLEPRYPWLAIVVATSEAALVGALADWFAVTALFRHPLGIPIPHTAIIPARKDRVGVTLGAFVQRNFLNRDAVRARLLQLQPARRLAEWLARPENARRLASQAARAVGAGAQLLRDEDIEAVLARALSDRVRSTPVAPLLGRLLALLTAGNKHQELLDRVLELTARALEENRDIVRQRVDKELPWWVPSAVDERITSRVVGALDRTLREIRVDPDHPLRLRFDAAIDEFIVKLRASPEVILKAERLKEELLGDRAMSALAADVWRDLKNALVRWAESPDEAGSYALARALATFGQSLLQDEELLARIDGWIVAGASALVERYQDEVGALIAQTVQRWDPAATSRRIELAIGRDLQFIRINGTLVGGLAGMLLYLISRAF
ncbi:MAG TPA: DUF445 domain-containing protein [Gemmatimonadaceae bacterium]|nr:DUF445 domain-containing protein [Gemmatimonadaceae bacterium]